jgi:hypothetical protein
MSKHASPTIDVKVFYFTYQGEPGENQVKSLIKILKHKCKLAYKRVTRAPDLTPVIKRIDTSKERTCK